MSDGRAASARAAGEPLTAATMTDESPSRISDQELLAAAGFVPEHGGAEHPQGGEAMPAWRRGHATIVQVAPGTWALWHPRLVIVYFDQCHAAIEAALATPAAIAACQRRASVRGWIGVSVALILTAIFCLWIVIAFDAPTVGR